MLSVPKTSSLCIFRSLEPSVRTLTPLKWRSVLTGKPNVINRLLKTRSIMQERQGAEREVQCLLKIGILARDRFRQGLTTTLTKYRSDLSGGAVWRVNGARFFVLKVTQDEREAVGAVFESSNGQRFVVASADSRASADRIAASAGPGSVVLAIQP